MVVEGAVVLEDVARGVRLMRHDAGMDPGVEAELLVEDARDGGGHHHLASLQRNDANGATLPLLLFDGREQLQLRRLQDVGDQLAALRADL